MSKAWSEKELQELADSNPRIAKQLRAEGVLPDEEGVEVAMRAAGWQPVSAPPSTNTALFLFGWTVIVLGWLVERVAMLFQVIGAVLEGFGGWIMQGGRAMRDHAERKS